MYVFNKMYNSIELLDDNMYTLIDSKKMEELKNEHQLDIQNGYGNIVFKNNELKYEPLMTTIAYDETSGQFHMTNDPDKVTDPYKIKEITLKEWDFWSMRRSAVIGQATILYWDDQFHEVPFIEDHIFDPKSKTMVLDTNMVLNRIKRHIHPEAVEADIRDRGFVYTIAGKSYLQPFRSLEDRSYYQLLKNDIPMEQRELKLYRYIDGEFTRDPLQYDVIKGKSISDEFLSNMIAKIIKYESYVKTAVNNVSNNIQSITNVTEAEVKASTIRQDAYNELERLIKEG
nr:MAG TPA: hypothetical protein [Caudoviricetes sp.]